MKKLSIVIMCMLLGGILNSCTTLGLLDLDYSEPQFDKQYVYVIDSFKADGEFEDYVKLHNASTDSGISFNIYVHHPSTYEWLVYGTGILKGHGDTDTIDSGMSGIDNYRYFAIEALNNKNYKYQFYTNRNDLHITIMDN